MSVSLLSSRWAIGPFLALVLALSVAPVSAADIKPLKTNSPNWSAFLLDGPIVEGDAARVRSAIAEVPPGRATTIVLNSLGGSLGEGIKLGLMFHDQRIATMVKSAGGACHSACAIAFLGGRRQLDGQPFRIKSSGAMLGLHAFRLEFDKTRIYTNIDMAEQVAVSQQIAFALIEYLRQIEEDYRILPLMLQAPANSLHYVSSDDALELGIHVLDEKTQKLISPETGSARMKNAMRAIGSAGEITAKGPIKGLGDGRQ